MGWFRVCVCLGVCFFVGFRGDQKPGEQAREPDGAYVPFSNYKLGSAS